MKLFNFLKKKEVHNFETLLQKAAENPSYQTEFSRRLLSEKLVIITNAGVATEGIQFLQEGTQVDIFSFDDGTIPIFTSTDRIFDKGVIKEQVNFLELTGRDLFSNLAVGQAFILNPYSDYGKELHPKEIASLLDGTMFKPKQIVFEKDTPVNIGQPAKYPAEVVKSLVRLFSAKPEVEAAYIAWIHDPASDDPPHYIFAIDAKTNYTNISNEAGFLTQEVLGVSEIVDFMQISNLGGINNYFLSITPFYKKRK